MKKVGQLKVLRPEGLNIKMKRRKERKKEKE